MTPRERLEARIDRRREWGGAAARRRLAALEPFLAAYVPRSQRAALRELTTGEEGDWYLGRLEELAELVRTMPRTYAGDGVARLHYFGGSADWWVTELDSEPEQHQAFGLADLGEPELGYLSIVEIVAHSGLELDLHFTPRPVAEIQAERAA